MIRDKSLLLVIFLAAVQLSFSPMTFSDEPQNETPPWLELPSVLIGPDALDGEEPSLGGWRQWMISEKNSSPPDRPGSLLIRLLVLSLYDPELTQYGGRSLTLAPVSKLVQLYKMFNQNALLKIFEIPTQEDFREIIDTAFEQVKNAGPNKLELPQEIAILPDGDLKYAMVLNQLTHLVMTDETPLLRELSKRIRIIMSLWEWSERATQSLKDNLDYLETLIPPKTQSPALPRTKFSDDARQMILIPESGFIIGSPENEGLPDEHPARRIYLSNYYMDQTEVTRQQYASFLNDYRENYVLSLPTVDLWLNVGDMFKKGPQGVFYLESSIKPDHPMTQVSWEGANAYCAFYGESLPTEFEWEKAAKGDIHLLSPDLVLSFRRYPWGNDWIRGGANTNENDGRNRTQEDTSDGTRVVGTLPNDASPYGVLDMAGNVREWTRDVYEADRYRHVSGYLAPPTAKISGESSALRYVIRGGSWDRDKIRARLSFRGYGRPPQRRDDLGFRCVSHIEENH